MNIEEAIKAAKNNPGKSSVGALITLVAAIAGGTLTLDERYAHASEVYEQFEEQKMFIQTQINTNRIKQLETEIFKLDFKDAAEKATPLDKALKERYKSELNRLK